MATILEDQFPDDPKIIFMGTPAFAVPSLRALISNEYKVLAVVTQPDRPKGRGRKIEASPVKKVALEHNILILQPEKVSDTNFCDQLGKSKPDIIVVVAFGQILKKELLMIPKWGAINLHASLLPKYRGAAPIQRAILNNDSLTGLTVMRMDEGMDTGPILYQEEVPILKDETAGQLHDRLSLESGDMIIRFFKGVAQNQFKEVPQDHYLATYAPKIEKNITMIDWGMDAIRISALIRALDPKPGACTTLGDKEIKLFSSRTSNELHSAPVPGRVVMGEGGSFHVETGKGMVEIREMQYPGKKRISSKDFLRGYAVPEGTILGK